MTASMGPCPPIGGQWALPAEYEKQLTDAHDALSAEDFFYFRVGEYTINHCK